MSRKTLFSFNLWKYAERIATASSECTAKHENKGSYNTDYIVADLIDPLAMIEKRSKRRLKKEISIIVKKYCTD